MSQNKCTCPVDVDITYTGHLSNCPQPAYEARCQRRTVTAPFHRKLRKQRDALRRLHVIIAAQQKQIERLLEARDAEQLLRQVARRQTTCAKKQLRKLQRERSPEAMRVVRWARRFINCASDWNLRHLRTAVNKLKP